MFSNECLFPFRRSCLSISTTFLNLPRSRAVILCSSLQAKWESWRQAECAKKREIDMTVSGVTREKKWNQLNFQMTGVITFFISLKIINTCKGDKHLLLTLEFLRGRDRLCTKHEKLTHHQKKTGMCMSSQDLLMTRLSDHSQKGRKRWWWRWRLVSLEGKQEYSPSPTISFLSLGL